eukprot:SAG11_NODE_6237_length_1355_cov_2.750796_2_plen_164_part_01
MALLCVGPDSGSRQWVPTVGPHNGSGNGFRQYPAVPGSGSQQWVPTMGSSSGFRQCVPTVGLGSGSRQWNSCSRQWFPGTTAGNNCSREQLLRSAQPSKLWSWKKPEGMPSTIGLVILTSLADVRIVRGCQRMAYLRAREDQTRNTYFNTPLSVRSIYLFLYMF